MYTIVTTPDKILLETAKPVSKFDRRLKQIAEEMEKTLRATVDPVGVGLAAPQVNISLRIFQMKPTEKSSVTTYVNPVIEGTSDDEGVFKFTNSEKIESKKPKSSKNKLLEGCLSIPNIWGNVTRKKEVTMSWQDLDGNKFKQTFTGFPAIIIQHELDHLNGVLFTKHVMEQGEQLYKSHKDEKGDDVFEEITL